MFYSKGFGLIYLEQLVGKLYLRCLEACSCNVDLFHWSKTKRCQTAFVVEHKVRQNKRNKKGESPTTIKNTVKQFT